MAGTRSTPCQVARRRQAGTLRLDPPGRPARAGSGGSTMARRRLMSEALREDLARELGVYELAARHGWGAVPARECGRLVQQAVLRAEALLAQQEGCPDAPVMRQQGPGPAPHALSPQVPPFVQNPSPWPGPWFGHATAAARPGPAHPAPPALRPRGPVAGAATGRRPLSCTRVPGSQGSRRGTGAVGDEPGRGGRFPGRGAPGTFPALAGQAARTHGSRRGRRDNGGGGKGRRSLAGLGGGQGAIVAGDRAGRRPPVPRPRARAFLRRVSPPGALSPDRCRGHRHPPAAPDPPEVRPGPTPVRSGDPFVPGAAPASAAGAGAAPPAPHRGRVPPRSRPVPSMPPPRRLSPPAGAYGKAGGREVVTAWVNRTWCF